MNLEQLDGERRREAGAQTRHDRLTETGPGAVVAEHG